MPLPEAFAQSVNLGNPPIVNFANQKFKIGTQYWDIAQDETGVLWFANNNGLLEFDGTHWRLYPLPNGTIVRSVRSAPGKKIYVGGQGDFGCFEPDERGRLRFRSFKNLLKPEQQQFADVWDVELEGDRVFFRTDAYVFCYEKAQISTWQAPCGSLFFMGRWRDKLMVQDGSQQLYFYNSGRFEPFAYPKIFNAGHISSVLTLNRDTVLITTIKDGIYYCTENSMGQWKTPDDETLRQNRIYCADVLPDGSLVLGTTMNGLFVLDKYRRIYRQVNKKSGLQNNTILSILALKNGSVWLGLDNGVGFSDLGSPFSTIYPDGDLQGTGYCVQIHGGKIYFGTNTGLYALDWKQYYHPNEQQRFAVVQHAEGQVWSLNRVGQSLLMGHHEGAFNISGLRAQKLTSLLGIWKFLDLGNGTAVAGHYNGLAAFKTAGAGWAFDRKLEGFSESSRILALDQDKYVWMAHPYRGVFRLSLVSEGVKANFFGEKQGLPSDFGNHLFKLGGRILVTGNSGVFNFDSTRNTFVSDAKFNQYFGNKVHFRYLMQDESDNIWYETDQETGVLLVENEALEKKIRRLPIPELKDKLTGGFPFVLPNDRNNVFIATRKGFIHFDLGKYVQADSIMRLVLHEVRLKNGVDSILFGGQLPASGLGKCRLQNSQNALVFTFSAPDYPGGELIRFTHKLEGLEQNWSEWNTETDITYNRLPPGEYKFWVKAQNQHGVESAPVSFAFSIMPPWYASKWAYAFYLLLLTGFVAGIIYRQRVHFEREKKDLQEIHQHREAQHQLHALRSEEAINQLKNEKLEAEITHKTQELVSLTMHLVQKNTIINAIQESLKKLQTRMKNPAESEREIARIIKILEHDSSLESDWENFSRNFDSVHSDFLKRLGVQFEHLSPNDYKMCAYLRMNLSSKEIASLMNISIRGVEASRYRLRKRLGLDSEANLTEFLMRF